MTITSKELAKIAGVNQSTVSRSLNNSPQVSEKTKKRILKLAKEYGFELNSHARSLKTNKAGTIGVIYPSHFVDFSTNMYMSSLHNLLRQSFESEEVDLLVLSETNKATGVNNIIKVVKNKKVDGFIFLKSNISQETHEFLIERNFPCVFLNCSEKENKMEFASVLVNNYQGGYNVGEYLTKLGHKDILCISAYDEDKELLDRTQGFKQALVDNHVEFNKEHCFYGDFTFKSGYNVILAQKDSLSRITAIFGMNDMMALGAMQALKELNISVPDDISIIGYDDLEMCTWYKPYLTTMHNPKEEVARLAKEFLLKLIEGEEISSLHIELMPKLIIRKST